MFSSIKTTCTDSLRCFKHKRVKADTFTPFPSEILKYIRLLSIVVFVFIDNENNLFIVPRERKPSFAPHFFPSQIEQMSPNKTFLPKQHEC